MRILLTGATGHLGPALAREFAGEELVALGHADLDVTDDGAVADAVRRSQPAVVINCAGYNDVDGAEEDALTALRVNAFAVQSLARCAAEANATFVHFGSDFVFDGETDRPYTEDDPPNPKSVYASSKLLGEWFARDAPQHYVLRVESLFGGPTAGKAARLGSLGRIVEGLRAGREVSVFTDRTVSPSFAVDVARTTRAVLERRPPPGLYHCTNSGSVTWEEVAREAARLLGCEPRLKLMTLADARLRAERPRYCALSNGRLARAGVVMPTWRDALRRYLATMRPAGVVAEE